VIARAEIGEHRDQWPRHDPIYIAIGLSEVIAA
jgi:hypothetical protein